jgi:toxin ParE1/3/4
VKLRYTIPALSDLSAILDYIATHSPQGANRVRGRIQALLDLLPSHPHIGTVSNDPNICRLTVSPYPYLVFYETAKIEIIIRAVSHPARFGGGLTIC